ncbi:hypothetical protein CHCC15292_2445 [Bacillus licheniformis]|uniref:YckD family protein n=1 Tax=Bacillus licheniformis TaxID=1402 RepID=UPI00130B6F8F|nr:YckD family protein [Bacillus licheniformis]TWL88760.1 hypothetical protein CHCC15292_2445 [Bacillus licheniformis]
MRKLCVCLLLVIPLSCTAVMPSAYGETRVYQELTDKQKNELASLQKDIMEKKKQLINKYVEYGILDQERGKEIKSHIEKRYEKELCQSGSTIKKSFARITFIKLKKTAPHFLRDKSVKTGVN